MTTPLTAVSTVTHTMLFLFRLPFFLAYAAGYFLVFHWLPLPVVARKVALWGLMAIPGIWWVDLQLDGVKRGTLADQPRDRFPHPGSVIAANFTSPVDAVYLAAILDPVFTVSYPGTRLVRPVGLLGAIINALGPVRTGSDGTAGLVSVEDLLRQYPGRVIAVFPECGTSNGRAILPLSPSLLATPPDVHIFPVSLRYTPPDVTTPVPGQWLRFLWSLLSRPTTCVRVRVAEGQLNSSAALTNGTSSSVDKSASATARRSEPELNAAERKVLDRIGEALARLGRVKRVGLTMQDKAEFGAAFKGKKRA